MTSNEWQPNKFTILPACEDIPGIFPTIFGLVHQQHPQAKMGIFTDWADLVRLVEPGVVPTVYTTYENEDLVLSRAIEHLSQSKPYLLFIHLDHVDHAGHTFGWAPPEYYAAVEKTDRMLGELMSMLDSLQLRNSTVVLLTADHGGVGKSHGGMTMAEIEIPWILAGPGTRKDYPISAQILQYGNKQPNVRRKFCT